MARLNLGNVVAQHYMWAGGHFILLISALRYLLATVLFRGPSPWWYKSMCYSSETMLRAMNDPAAFRSGLHWRSGQLCDCLPVGLAAVVAH